MKLSIFLKIWSFCAINKLPSALRLGVLPRGWTVWPLWAPGQWRWLREPTPAPPACVSWPPRGFWAGTKQEMVRKKPQKSTIMAAVACWYVPASEFTFFYCLLLYCLFLKYNRSIFYCALKLFVTHLSWIEIPFTNVSPHLRKVYKCN